MSCPPGIFSAGHLGEGFQPPSSPVGEAVPILPPHRNDQPRVSLWGWGWGAVTTGPLEWELASAGLTKVQPDLGPSRGTMLQGSLRFSTFTAGGPTPECPSHYSHPMSASAPRLAVHACLQPSRTVPLLCVRSLLQQTPSFRTCTPGQVHVTQRAGSD